MKQFFINLFNRKKAHQATQSVEVREYSQPHALNAYMIRAGIKHGEQVEANLNNVRIERTDKLGEPKPNSGEVLSLFFCPMGDIDVLQKLTKGDNLPLPNTATLHNFKVGNNFKPGLYNLKKVMLHANGTINVTATENTRMELVH